MSDPTNLWEQGGALTYSTPPAEMGLSVDRQSMLASLARTKNQLIGWPGGPQGIVDMIASNVAKNSLGVEVLTLQASQLISREIPPVARDWWFLSLKVTLSSSAGYAYDSGTRRGPYLKGFSVKVSAVEPAATAVTTHASVPETPVGTKEVTDTIEGSLSGNIGMFGETVTGGVGGSVSYSHSVGHSVPDLEIDNIGTPAGVVAWAAKVNMVGDNPHISGFGIAQDIPDVPQVGRANFQQEFAWVWFYPKSDRVFPKNPTTKTEGFFSFRAEVDLTYEFAWTNLIGMRLQAPVNLTIPLQASYPPDP